MDRAYRELIMENIEYDILAERYSTERLDERPSPYRDGFYTDGPHPDDGENANIHLPLRVYVENIRDERLGGFTMPLPRTTGGAGSGQY